MERPNATKPQVHIWGVFLTILLAVIIFGIWSIYSSEENQQNEKAEANSAFLREVEKTKKETLGQITSSEKRIIDTLTGVVDQKITEAVNYLGEKFTARFDTLDKKMERMDAKSDANWAKYKSGLVSVKTIKSSPQKSSQVSRSQRDAERRTFVNRVNKLAPGTFPNSMDTKEEPISSTPPANTSFLKQSSITSNLSPANKPSAIVIVISLEESLKVVAKYKASDHPWLN